jgi:hypothetical protein
MGITSQPRNTARRPAADSRLKLHLRLLPFGGRTYHIVTLRPGTATAFSTNFFHETWHIVTSQGGAQLLARLLWGLSYQRHPGTLVLIHGGHLLPTPFEAERSDPILLIPAGLTPVDPSAFRALKDRLNCPWPPAQTIRWQTFGLDAALEGGPGSREGDGLWKENRHLWQQERMERRGGFICYSASPPILRQQALRIHGLKVRKGRHGTDMDYHFLAESSSQHSWWGDGEVQIFADYMDRVAAAALARRELVANPNQPILSETLQEVVSRRRDQIKARRVRGKKRWAVGSA